MTREQEREIITRVLQGETDAFEQLVLDNEARVYNIALRMLGNEEDAKDIAQETFLKAYRTLEHFRGDSSFSSWLYRMTTNLCIDFKRRGKNRAASLTYTEEDGSQSEFDIADESASPEKALEQTELRAAIEAALLELTPEHRQTVVLRELGGLSYAEIAQELDLELGTVKSRIARARLQMRSFLIKSGNFSAHSASERVKGGGVRE